MLVDTPAGRLGLTVCYDLRFPELFRKLVSEGAEIFSVPSAFTGPTGRAHWETLLRARAIEDLCFVVAAAQSGIHDSNRETYGDSLIADYWGRVLAREPRGSGVVVAALDRDGQKATRESFPALKHRVLAMTGDALQCARDRILSPSGLDDRRLEQALGSLLGASVDAADLYFQLAREEHWALEDGIVKEGSHGIEQGVGVRAMAGRAHRLRLFRRGRAGGAARGGASGARHRARGRQRPGAGLARDGRAPPVPGRRPDRDARRRGQGGAADRARPLRAGARSAREAGGRDARRRARDHPGRGERRHAGRRRASAGAHERLRDRRAERPPRAGLRGHRRSLFARGVHRGREAAAPRARSSSPGDRQPRVGAGACGHDDGRARPGWPGVLLHEAIGHGLEGDFNRRGTSAFTGRIGERVASELCTVVDDGTLPGRRGSLNIDDEGTPTSCTTLIENGVLKGYLQDKLNARLMGMQPTGNGRRESFAHTTLPRMTNTYMLAGPHDPEEIIRSVKSGLYAVNFGGGQVDITSGKFVFSASEAYLIEDGKVTAPVKGATLVGNGPDVLTRVSMVGNDLMLDEGIGSCGKDGQTVPVGVGQPTLRVDALTVGGTA